MIKLLISISFAIAIISNPIYAQYDFTVSLIPDSLSSSANSVIRHSKTNLDIYDGKLIYNYDYAITALNKKHEDKLLFAESFVKGEGKIKDVEIKVYDADGQLIKKIKKKEIKEYGLQDIEFADDTRTMIYRHSSSVFPVTMHVVYTHEIFSPYYLRSWYPISDFRQSVEFASIKIVDHVGESFDFQSRDLPEPIEHDLSTLHYEYKQGKSLAKEKYMPNIRKCFPNLELALKRIKFFDHVGKVNNWEEYGSWLYNEMFLPKLDVDLSLLKEETSQIINDTDGELVKAQKLYQYIQETTRYVLISLEDGGLSPLAISTVHDRKYGDCKALSFYYNTLCRAHGIDATLALVYAGKSKLSAKEDFYSSSQFNHVISKLDIEGETYWVDCTSKVDPFNFLGQFTDDRNVLLFNNDLGTITKTPAYKYSRKTSSSMSFSEDGNLEGSIDFNTEGIGINRKLYKLPNFSSQELASYKKGMLSEYTNPKIESYSYQFDTSNLNIKESFKIICSNAGEKFGEHFKIKINRDELEVPKLKKDKNRVWPIQILRSKEYEATTRLKHDLAMVPITDEDVMLDSDFGTYSFSTITTAGEILIKRSLKINKATYTNDRYNEIKSFFDKIRKIERRSILLSSKS